MANTQWALDAAHSDVQFKIRHMMVSNVTGQFKNFTATVETEGDDMSTAKVHFTADVDSISTNNETRDGHLKNGDFFDAANHPKIVFNSTKMEKVDEENYKMHGVLEMRGVTNNIVLNVTYSGTTKDPYGNTRVGFEVTGKINRKAHGVIAPMEAGGAMLGEDVNLHANTEFTKQVATAA